MITYKINKVENRSLILVCALALTITLVAQTTVLAGVNDTGQSASTTKTTTFTIGGSETGTKDTNLTTITFPEGAPEATIDTLSNNLDAADPQVLSATTSEPVAKIKNTHATTTYNVVLEITTWTESAVNMEYYNLATDGATDISTVTAELSNASGAANIVSTGVSIGPEIYKDLYLKLLLGSVAGKTGTSTLTVLGESA